ncbi:MAG: DegV family protein, partial [Coriobacteriales bacterium]|nr:DegV family protein [Coriobacteriales bacterium]
MIADKRRTRRRGSKMIRIITDSTASIPAEMAKEHGIQVVTMRLTYKGVEYDDATMDL